MNQRGEVRRALAMQSDAHVSRRRRKLLLAASACACMSPSLVRSQGKIARVGFLAGRGAPSKDNLDPNFNYFREGLRELGRIEGKNIHIEYRYADSDRARGREQIAELVQMKVDVIVTRFGVFEAKAATKEIPVVALPTGDPVESGLIASLSRPGANVTGVAGFRSALSGKLLELSKDLIPGLTRVGILHTAAANLRLRGGQFESAARTLKIQLSTFPVATPNADLAGAVQAAVDARVQALIITRNPVFSTNAKMLFEHTNKARLPTICESPEEAASGGLLSYSPSDAEIFKRAAVLVDKILKGAKPADLPFEQPTTFELVVNMKTAKLLGITVPQIILVRADRLIE